MGRENEDQGGEKRNGEEKLRTGRKNEEQGGKIKNQDLGGKIKNQEGK